ncbi:HAD family hydrolase [Paenibacillus sp. J5C_2022]|uniref:HAD family hydrolase n=1 Tax=Paenibacillus sp. J5C2022 TaxID=2977129 RepID=UPI0021CEEDFE|nr:HAD family hydrolase [Paenibacillus sp. J5C2022]MCU6709050.1 HAD family hydrolase [Paenibacillus sp. J5C2022]
MYTCIIFDIDGTMINTEKAMIESMRQALYEVTGSSYSYNDLLPFMGIPGDTALQQLGIENIAAVNKRWSDYLGQYANDIHLYPGIDVVVKTLHDMGIATGVVTSKTRRELKDEFAPFGLMPYLPISVCADDTLLHKPNPEPMLEFLELSAIDKSRCIYIGDTIYDHMCASSAGVDFALATWGASAPDRIDAKFKLKDPSDILQLVQGVLSQ